MRDTIKTFIWHISSQLNLISPIYEIGSKQSIGQAGYADLRPFFKGKEYIGCDFEKGIGVDRIENIEALSFRDESIPTLLCLDTLEHVEDPIGAMEEIYRVLNSIGIIIISSHMWFPVHYKIDYWRFTPQCFEEVLLKKFPLKEVYFMGEKNFPHLLIGLGCKKGDFDFKINTDELNQMLPCPYPYRFEKYKKE